MTANPTRQTRKGHGFTQGQTVAVYGGSSATAPSGEARVGVITWSGTEVRVEFEDGGVPFWCGVAGKFWAAPVEETPAAPVDAPEVGRLVRLEGELGLWAVESVEGELVTFLAHDDDPQADDLPIRRTYPAGMITGWGEMLQERQGRLMAEALTSDIREGDMVRNPGNRVGRVVEVWRVGEGITADRVRVEWEPVEGETAESRAAREALAINWRLTTSLILDTPAPPVAPRIVTLVNDGRGRVQAHAVGCAHLNRTPPGSARWNSRPVDSRRAVILEVFGGFEGLEEDGSNWRDFLDAQDPKMFAPCLDTLPGESPEDMWTAQRAREAFPVHSLVSRPTQPSVYGRVVDGPRVLVGQPVKIPVRWEDDYRISLMSPDALVVVSELSELGAEVSVAACVACGQRIAQRTHRPGCSWHHITGPHADRVGCHGDGEPRATPGEVVVMRDGADLATFTALVEDGLGPVNGMATLPAAPAAGWIGGAELDQLLDDVLGEPTVAERFPASARVVHQTERGLIGTVTADPSGSHTAQHRQGFQADQGQVDVVRVVWDGRAWPFRGWCRPEDLELVAASAPVSAPATLAERFPEGLRVAHTHPELDWTGTVTASPRGARQHVAVFGHDADRQPLEYVRIKWDHDPRAAWCPPELLAVVAPAAN